MTQSNWKQGDSLFIYFSENVNYYFREKYKPEINWIKAIEKLFYFYEVVKGAGSSLDQVPPLETDMHVPFEFLPY